MIYKNELVQQTYILRDNGYFGDSPATKDSVKSEDERNRSGDVFTDFTNKNMAFTCENGMGT